MSKNYAEPIYLPLTVVWWERHLYSSGRSLDFGLGVKADAGKTLQKVYLQLNCLNAFHICFCDTGLESCSVRVICKFKALQWSDIDRLSFACRQELAWPTLQYLPSKFQDLHAYAKVWSRSCWHSIKLKLCLVSCYCLGQSPLALDMETEVFENDIEVFLQI